MTRRPAITLMEVLITMFIMAIGMLALLVLFPVGAMSMAQALKDDRCASSASMAEQFAIAKNVRHDSLVLPYFTTQFTQTLQLTYNGPSYPVYVDPYGVMSGVTQLGFKSSTSLATFNPSFIQRTTVSYAASPQLVDRWFSLPNDITFLSAGVPDLTGGIVDRGREYSWAYMVQRPQTWVTEAANISVVVYRKRPIAVADQEVTYPAAGVATTSGLTLTWTPPQSPNLKRGVWLLDTTPLPYAYVALNGTVQYQLIPAAKFYRVVNVSDSLTGQATLDVQPNLANNVTQVVVMDYVAEVINKGTSWKP
ncbi:MAG: type IV pilus modification PilV family protein [Gemmataceae bacterium]